MSSIGSDDEGHDIVQKRRLRAVLSDPCPSDLSSIPAMDLDNYSPSASVMMQAIAKYHKKLPTTCFMKWLSNLRSVLQAWATDGKVSAGSGCTGTDMWIHCMNSLLSHWHGIFGLGELSMKSVFVSENEEAKKQFLKQQHDFDILVPDVAQFKEARVWNEKTQRATVLPWTVLYAGGFSCKGNSKQNKNRGLNKGCIRSGETSSGITFEAMRSWILKSRPKIAWLENVPEVQQSVDVSGDGLAASDADYIESCFKEHDFTVVTTCFSAMDYGSAAERVRWWAVIFDIPACHSKEVKDRFHEILAALKIGAFPVDAFLLQDAVIASICEPLILGDSVAKRQKTDSAPAQWKMTHETAFMQHDLLWPPLPVKVEPLLAAGFRQREAELVYFANVMFPSNKDGKAIEGQWAFMDANHSFERTFRWPLSEGQELTNPWRTCVPTMTANSAMAARRSKYGKTEIKKIHGLEAMRLIGWDLGFWANSASPFVCKSVSPELLSDLAGNAWSSFAFIPLAISALGAAPASFYHQARPSLAAASAPDTAAEVVSDSDSSGASS